MGLDLEQDIKEIKSMTDFALCDPGQSVKLPGREGTGVFIGSPLKASCSCLHGGVLASRPVVLCFRKNEDGNQAVCLESFYNLPKTQDRTRNRTQESGPYGSFNNRIY